MVRGQFSNRVYALENNVRSDDLSVFLMVLREGGFRAAAHQLGVAPSKVSATVARLERQLGVPLLLRTTRSVRATDQGQALAERVRPLYAEIASACAEIAGGAARLHGRLKLNVPGAVMPDILPPLLAAYHRQHPDVTVEIMVENDLVDIIAAGCDAGIRYGSVIDKGMISIPVGPRRQRFALAASPDYVRRRSLPQTPSDLGRHDAIRYRLPNGSLIPWTLQNTDKIADAAPSTVLALGVNALDSGLAFARSGVGIIGAFHNWLDHDFRDGSLVPILQEYWPTFDGPRLYYASRLAPPPLRAFIEICGGHEWE